MPKRVFLLWDYQEIFDISDNRDYSDNCGCYCNNCYFMSMAIQMGNGSGFLQRSLGIYRTHEISRGGQSYFES
jgi:hypothetical protein